MLTPRPNRLIELREKLNAQRRRRVCELVLAHAQQAIEPRRPRVLEERRQARR